MNKRQIIIVAIALGILLIGKLSMDSLGKPAEKPVKKVVERITTVFTEEVKNDSIAIYMESTGSLEALNRLELYSEVQGLMEADHGRFKAGNSFKKGDVLVSIRSNDQQAQLYAQRSSFESTITSIMPDLKADYPSEFVNWNTYLQSLSSSNSTPELPKVESNQLRSFLIGRGVYNAFHSLKNVEILNSKYRLVAPYDGVLIAANVDPGTVIRPGQALGVFIQPMQYELETSIDAISAERLNVGQSVELTMQGLDSKKWNGKIARLVKAIDKNSQLSTFFVSVEGKDLKEGMFLQAKVKANEVTNAFEISRSALLDGNQVYVVENGKLVIKNISNEHQTQKTVVVTGLKDGEEVLTKIPPSAFPGMKVSVYKED
mgnify:CR=1 FL=1